MVVIKRNGSEEAFDLNKIANVIEQALRGCGKHIEQEIETVSIKFAQDIENDLNQLDQKSVSVELIQSCVEEKLMKYGYYAAARNFILYREKHADARFIRERMDYMDRYMNESNNASTASETDSNANMTSKNVANMEGEVYKSLNRIVQRQRMKSKLKEMYPELAKQYERDLNHHILYTHDESTSPAIKKYCLAASLYPLMTEGVGNIDGVTPSAPNDLQSFSGQITNLIFLLSSQAKGAVAVGEYFIALNYYVIAEFGKNWWQKLHCETGTSHCKVHRTIRDQVYKAFKQFVWGVNQPAGNRGFQSPFTNISYYDHTYFDSLFGSFYYPDGTQPEWEAIDTLQRLFMKWFNKLRTRQVLTFPVETFAMVHDNHDIIDKEYKELCAEMYAEGHSFFTYISDSADSLASCCRLRNELATNTFSPTSGLTGVMTGSCNVITLNINRITQDWYRSLPASKTDKVDYDKESLRQYLVAILDRVYKYHIAYKTMLYEMEDKKMFADSNAGYIYINKLYSTVGVNGLNEAARYLGLKVSNNPDYIAFLQLILGTIKEQNKLHSVHDKKYPFLFNSEVVPAESLGTKNYNWDKEDGYFVPEDENLYNSYFYNAHDNTSLLDKFILHGKQTYQYTDGGSALHANLDSHLSKAQYLKLIDFAIANGTSYFTFNIPNTKCEDCGHIVKVPVEQCPKCKSRNLTQYTRIIGYLRATKVFDKNRQIEASKRVYLDGRKEV